MAIVKYDLPPTQEAADSRRLYEYFVCLDENQDSGRFQRSRYH